MAQKTDRLAFIGVISAITAIALAITAWAAALKPASNSPSAAAYRPQHLNLY
jgi:hypothetical protein